jgi:uncharacterized 2Fe-2S/4Fe-4S cluster protein (DUF4445 family)
MPEIRFMPSGVTVSVNEASSIRDAAIKAGVELYAPCAGFGICGKCAVKILSGQVRGEVDENSLCLACRTFPHTDCSVEIPGLSAAHELQTVVKGPGRKYEISPVSGLEKGALGVAVDLGTTTIAAVLADLESGEILSADSELNPQSNYGDDVVSRIGFASTPENLTKLQSAATESIDRLISRLCLSAHCEREKIHAITVAGNATMLHLLLGVSPHSLGQAPYTPAFTVHKPVLAEDLSINVNPDALLRTLPNIAGFIGGDTVAGILATGMGESGEIKLFIDIGTNGEIVVGNRNRLTATSAAAGPAFEGGRIEKGMRAEPGAIDHVTIKDGEIKISTVGGEKPVGICGTGLIESVAAMLTYGLLRPDGKFPSDEIIHGMTAGMASRYVKVDGSHRFVLYSDGEREVWLSQKDISELQLAKAAIRSGLEILVAEYGGGYGSIGEILIAGAFGYYLKPHDLVAIGFLSEIDESKVRFVGNTSLEGALMALLSVRMAARAVEISRTVSTVELAGRKNFEDMFVQHIHFP